MGNELGTTAVYLRVSSRRQDEASQIPDVERWIRAQPEHVQDGITTYRDKFTGKSMDRPGWRALEQAIRDGEVTTVVVWRLDRLGRTAAGLTQLFQDWSTKGVNLVSLKDGLDLSTAAGRLMANVLASVAQYETEMRAERVLAGIEVARAKGVRFGRPPGPGKAIKVTDEQRAVARSLEAKGEGITSIARATGLSKPTVRKILG